MIYVITSYQLFDDISYSFKLKIIFMGEWVWGFPILTLDTLSSWEGGSGNPILRPRYSLYMGRGEGVPILRPRYSLNMGRGERGVFLSSGLDTLST